MGSAGVGREVGPESIRADRTASDPLSGSVLKDVHPAYNSIPDS